MRERRRAAGRRWRAGLALQICGDGVRRVVVCVDSCAALHVALCVLGHWNCDLNWSFRPRSFMVIVSAMHLFSLDLLFVCSRENGVHSLDFSTSWEYLDFRVEVRTRFF